MSAPLSVALASHHASAEAPTGAERSLALLACGLAGRGHRVRLLVPGPWVLAAEVAGAGVEVRVAPTRPLWLVTWNPQPWPVAAAKWLRWAAPGGGARTIAAELRDARPDVLHVNCLPHLDAARAGRRAGIPVVWHVREMLPPGARRRWFAGRLARDATRIVAVSRAVAAWLAEEGLGTRTTVVHNGVEPPPSLPEPAAARRELGLPAGGVVAGLFGSLLPDKGCEAFVEAAGRAMTSVPDLRAVLAGAGPRAYADRLRRLAGALGEGHVRVLPPQPDAWRLVAAADVVCLASTVPDSLPRTLLEAMAAGRPAIASAAGGAPELVDDGRTGLLVPPGDVEALAAALVRLAGDEGERGRMGAAARRRAQESFGLDRHLERMEAVLRQAAAVRAGGR